MARMMVGSVASLWRYPVKSMLGEQQEALEITPKGVLGDRAYALWDVESERIASAKNPKKWAKLLDFQAAFVAPVDARQPLPSVKVSLPDGITITSEAPDVNTVLSTVLERQVKLLSAAPEAPSLDQYWPDVEGTLHRDTTTQLMMPSGTFFDSCPIHAITTSTLARLKQLYPDGAFEPCRFRPNLLIEPVSQTAEFVEDAWIGQVLAIGETVRLQIDTACPRCVVTTLAQSGLPEDLDILRTTAKYNNVIAGIRLSVLRSGMIRQGDAVWLESAA
jgi:uncharacterized protein YcbX